MFLFVFDMVCGVVRQVTAKRRPKSDRVATAPSLTRPRPSTAWRAPPARARPRAVCGAGHTRSVHAIHLLIPLYLYFAPDYTLPVTITWKSILYFQRLVFLIKHRKTNKIIRIFICHITEKHYRFC